MTLDMCEREFSIITKFHKMESTMTAITGMAIKMHWKKFGSSKLSTLLSPLIYVR